MTEFSDWIQSVVTIDANLILKLILTALILILIWLLRRWGLGLVARRFTALKTRYNAERISIYLAYLVSAITIAVIWIDSARQVGTFLGLLSAGLAIALKDPIMSLIGWAYILWRKPFSVGDRVEIGPHAGDVIDVNLFQFSLMEIGNWVQADQSTGRIIHIPNGRILIEPLANYTEQFEYIWNEIPVMITFESNWQKAKQILQEIVERHSPPVDELQPKIQKPDAFRRYYFFYTHLTPAVYTSGAASGVMLTLRYLCEARNRRNSSQAIWEDILSCFDQEPDIQLAYPTQRQVVDLHHSNFPKETS